jgi:hypothetical protein
VNTAELFRWLTRRPFRPFRIRMTDGAALDVRHPEEVVPYKTTAWVARGPAGETFEQHVTISLLHVIRLEPVETEP